MFQALAYLDVNHPVVAWAAYRGTLVSAATVGAAPTDNARPVSMMFAGMIQQQANSRLNNELLIDMVRRQRHSHNVSRLTGMYFFADFSEAKVAESWGAHFRPENLGEFEIHTTSPLTRVDSNWITYAPRDAEGRLRASDLSWIDRYWAGEAHDDGPVWETSLTAELSFSVPNSDSVPTKCSRVDVQMRSILLRCRG